MREDPRAEARLARRAQREARALTRTAARSFYLSAWLLRPTQRQAFFALYAFCRRVDDLVDHPGADPAAALQAWRVQSRQPAAAQTDPILYGWAQLRDTYGIDQQLAETLMDGCAQDLVQTRYATMAELDHYCYMVASTVGLMSLPLLAVPATASVTAGAVTLGRALQLTNIIRDVGEDAARGRIYVPQALLATFGVAEADVLARQASPALLALLADLTARARQDYAASLPALRLLPPSTRTAMLAVAQLYAGILDAATALGPAILGQRAALSLPAKLRRLPAIWWTSRRLGQSSWDGAPATTGAGATSPAGEAPPPGLPSG